MSVGTDGRLNHGRGHDRRRRTPAPDAGSPERLGRFRYFFDDDRWEWSPQVQALHGYAPGTVTPTSELVLSHQHPDDPDRLTATMDDVRRNLRPVSSHHRIVDTAGDTRHVLVVADPLIGDSGRVTGIQGFFVDLTSAQDTREQQITAAVAEIAENRAVIEQAKGMLMAVYGLDADAAFELLRWQSQNYNVKLRSIAEQVASDFTDASRHQAFDRTAYDGLLLTAHERIAER
jgi:PAS domain S-box-containing protein